jgi:Flp pilus assembly protein TadB
MSALVVWVFCIYKAKVKFSNYWIKKKDEDKEEEKKEKIKKQKKNKIVELKNKKKIIQKRRLIFFLIKKIKKLRKIDSFCTSLLVNLCFVFHF